MLLTFLIQKDLEQLDGWTTFTYYRLHLLLSVYRVPIYPIQNDFSATYHTICIECHHSITIAFCIVYRFVPCTIVNSSLTNCIWIVIITLTFILKGKKQNKKKRTKQETRFFLHKISRINKFQEPVSRNEIQTLKEGSVTTLL